MITQGDVEYEGSIEIPTDLMEAADLWEGEKVLVASISTGNRLETYVQPGPPGTGASDRRDGSAQVGLWAFGLAAVALGAAVVAVAAARRN